MNTLPQLLFKPVDIASIVFVRIAFGIILFINIVGYLYYDFATAVWVEPEFLFKYWGFGWVDVLPAQYLYVLIFIVALSALFISIGFLYRISTVIFFLGFSYLFLLEQSMYLNHYYLVILVALLFIFIPANRSFSVDALIWPGIRSNTINAWCLWILMFQIGVVYFFGGLAKLNPDWLRGWPLWMWLNQGYIGSSEHKVFFVYFVAYFGLLFDLFIVPLLLYRRTRLLGFMLAIAFHITNKLLFNIGIFPYLSLVLTTLYFSPSWPRKLLSSEMPQIKVRNNIEQTNTLSSIQKVTLFFLTIYIAFQVLFPLRHFLYPGYVSWTEEGHKFSWHMKLRDKKGSIKFYIRDPIRNKEWELNPSVYLNARQKRMVSTRPYMMIQFAHFMEEQFRALGYKDVEVRVNARVSLNGRKKQIIIDPNVDLTMHRHTIRHSPWIMPLVEPLRDKNH